MPGTPPLSPIGFLDLVGPVRDLAESAPARRLAVREAVGFEQIEDLGVRFRIEKAPRDLADHAMALWAPGDGRLSRRQQCEQRRDDPQYQQRLTAA
jgi:hypothetical protein